MNCVLKTTLVILLFLHRVQGRVILQDGVDGVEASAPNSTQVNDLNAEDDPSDPANWPAKNPFTIRFAVALYNTENATSATREIESGYEFWQYVLNKKGGIPFGENKNALVEVKFLRYEKDSDDDVNKQRHRDVLTKAVTQGDVDFILGGDTLFAQEELFVSQQQRRLTLLCCHGPPLVYRQAAEAAAENGENMLFGIHVNSELYTNRLIRSIVVNEKADKIALVVSNRNTSIFTATAAESASLQLKLLNYTGIYANFPSHEVIEIPQESTENIEFYKKVARRIRDENFDTVFGFTLEPGGSFLLKSLQEEKAQLKTVFVTVTPTNNASVSELVKSGVQMEHILSAGQWHVQLNFGENPETYNPADAAAAQLNLRGDAVALDSVVSKRNIQDRVLWPTSTYFAEMFERYKNSTEPVTYTQASAAAAAYALQLGITEAFKSCQGIETWNGSTESLFFTTKWSCGSQSTYSLGGTQQTGYQLVLRALRALNRDTFFGKVFFSQDQRNVGRDAVTYQLLNQTESRFKFLNDVSFGLDFLPNTTNSTTLNKVKLVQEVVLPSEYETKRLVLPRPPRITDVDWCEGGTGLDENGECGLCSAGEHRASFSGEAGVDLFKFTCSKCNLTSYQECSGATECNSCPENSETGKLGATSLYDCTCQPGYYNETFSPGVNCTSCPEGAECPGGLAPLILDEGYWSENATAGRAYRPKEGEFKIMPCTPPSSCANDETKLDECSVGWGGNLCSLCGYNNANDTQDYFLVFGSCKKCTSPAVNLLIFLGVLMLWLVINLSMAEELQSFALLIDWFQLMSLVGAINVAWPRSLQKFFSVSAFFAFEVDVVSLRCINPNWNFFWDMVLQFSLPFAITALYLILGLWLKLYRDFQEKGSQQSEAENTGSTSTSGKLNSAIQSFQVEGGEESTDESENGFMHKEKSKSFFQRAASLTARTLERSNVEFSFASIGRRALNLFEITYLASVQYGFSALRSTTIGNQKVLAKAAYMPQTTSVLVVGAIGLAVLGVAFTLFLMIFLWSFSPDCPFRSLPDDVACKEEDPGGFVAPESKQWLDWLYKDFRMEVYYMASMHLVHRFFFAAAVSLIVMYQMQLMLGFGLCFFPDAPWTPAWSRAFLYCNWAMIITVFGILTWVIAMDSFEWWAYRKCKLKVEEYIAQRGITDLSSEHIGILIDVFSPTRLWSWIKYETNTKTNEGTTVRLRALLYTPRRLWRLISFKTEKKKHTPVADLVAEGPLEDLTKLIIDLAKYKNIIGKQDYSWLSLNDEAELWRSLVNTYPGIVSYIFNGSNDQVDNLYEFYATFYENYWNMQESWLGDWYNNLYKLSLKSCWKKLTSIFNELYTLPNKLLNRPQRLENEPSEPSANGASSLVRHAHKQRLERKSVVTIASSQKPQRSVVDQRVDHVAWLLQSRDRPFIARWLVMEPNHESRMRFNKIINDISSVQKSNMCFEETAIKYLSFGMYSLFHKTTPEVRRHSKKRKCGER